MISKLDKHVKIGASMCDNKGYIGIPNVFSLFMDLASEHAPQIGVGADKMKEKGVFWVTIRTKVIFHRFPKLLQDVTASTWPEVPKRNFCTRYYKLMDGEELLIEGKTEWAVINVENNRLGKVTDIYPNNIEHCTDVVCEESFSRMSKDFSDCELVDTYKVKSTDIDVAQHMNNAAYVRVLFGVFACKELEDMNIKDVEFSFRSQCYEGEIISIYHRQIDNKHEYGMLKDDGTVLVTAQIIEKYAVKQLKNM